MPAARGGPGDLEPGLPVPHHGQVATHSDWPRLAAFVRERRTDMGLTQEDVRAAGGPSTATMRLIEGGLQGAFQPATLRDLEDALRWRRGSVRAVLSGGDPVPLGEAAAPAPPPPRPAPVPGQDVRAALYEALRALNAPLREQVLAEARSGALADPLERMIWESPEFAADERAEEIVNLRARRAGSAARRAAG